MEGPSAGKGVLGGGGELRPRNELEICGCVCRGESGIEFGSREPVSEAGRGFVRGAELPRSSEREFGRRVDLDRFCDFSLAHRFVTSFTRRGAADGVLGPNPVQVSISTNPVRPAPRQTQDPRHKLHTRPSRCSGVD